MAGKKANACCVDSNKCLKCGGCISVCRFNAIDMPHSNIVIDSNSCTGCGVCFAACPVSALRPVTNNKE